MLVSGKAYVDNIRADHGQRAQRTALVFKQKFLLSSSLIYDDRFDGIH